MKLESKDDRLVIKEEQKCESEKEALTEVTCTAHVAIITWLGLPAQLACKPAGQHLQAMTIHCSRQRTAAQRSACLPSAHPCLGQRIRLPPVSPSAVLPPPRAPQTAASGGSAGSKLRRLGDFSVCTEAGIPEPVEGVEYAQGDLFLSGGRPLHPSRTAPAWFCTSLCCHALTPAVFNTSSGPSLAVEGGRCASLDKCCSS